MTSEVFSVPIFFIVFRDTLEAAIIISVLLSLVEQIVHSTDSGHLQGGTAPASREEGAASSQGPSKSEDYSSKKRRLIRKIRLQIFAGFGFGFLAAGAIGAAFISVWFTIDVFTEGSDIWKTSEELWKGTLSLITSLLIFVMGINILKLNQTKEDSEWRIKLQRAFEEQDRDHGWGHTGKWALFLLPFVAILRGGVEAIVFVGGVSLDQSATSIPIATIVGIVCGLICGFIIYVFASRATPTVSFVVMTNFLLLIGAGLFSKAVGHYQENAFSHLIGADAVDTYRDGPGSFDLQGNVWHLDCCNPENNLDGKGWMIFGAIFGWTNSATLGTVLSYVFFWITTIVTLVGPQLARVLSTTVWPHLTPVGH